MKKLRILLLSLTVLSAVSCSKDEAVEQKAPDSFKFTLNATLPDVVDTRVAAEAVARLTWTAGDKLSVINLTTGKALGGDLTADVSGNKSTFSGTLTGTVNSGDKLAFLYPSQGYTVETDFSSATLDFSTQDGTVGDKFAVYATYTATSNSISSAEATFNYLMSYMKITLTDLAASSAVKGATIGNINNALTLSISGGELVSTASGIGKTIVVTPASTVTTNASGVATLRIAVPASETATRSITIYDGTHYYKTSFTAVALLAGQYYGAAVTGFDLTKPLVYIPDANFKSYLVGNFDTDSDGEISFAEALVPTSITCSNKGITDFTGVEAFTNLTNLSCSSNQLTTLDISANTALQYLDCGYNQLTTLNVSGATALKTLYCEGNKLNALNVSANTALGVLSCQSNYLYTLDVTANTALTYLGCFSNRLKTLDLTANTALQYLYCTSNQITSLDLTANTALKTLWCNNNRLATINISANTALTELRCSGQTTNGTTSQNIVIQANATQYPNWTTICQDEDSWVSCVQI